MSKPKITEWPDRRVRGSKRTHADYCDWMSDWFCGYGKEPSCQFEGSWWDLICFARNVLASENTRLAAPEYHRPEWANDNYTDEPPYEFVGERDA